MYILERNYYYVVYIYIYIYIYILLNVCFTLILIITNILPNDLHNISWTITYSSVLQHQCVNVKYTIKNPKSINDTFLSANDF